MNFGKKFKAIAKKNNLSYQSASDKIIFVNLTNHQDHDAYIMVDKNNNSCVRIWLFTHIAFNPSCPDKWKSINKLNLNVKYCRIAIVPNKELGAEIVLIDEVFHGKKTVCRTINAIKRLITTFSDNWEELQIAKNGTQNESKC